ncbi:MAG: ATP-binding protein [Desulfobulbaceae bacterium]|nr:ATP-binding protein [Desulfobulbaceae bacterium]
MRLKLTTKRLMLFSALLAIGVISSMAALGYAWQMRKTMATVISKNSMEMMAAAELDIALLKQQHEIVSRVLAGNNQRESPPATNLADATRETLSRFANSTVDPKERALVDKLGSTFSRYDALRDKILTLFRAGDPAKAKALAIDELDALYHESAGASDLLVAMNNKDIREALRQGDEEIQRFQKIIAASIMLTGLLGFLLIWVLFHSVFEPLRQLARELQGFPQSSRQTGGASHEDDLELLVDGLKLFVSEGAGIRSDLASSRNELHQAQRLAALGNTVAQVAHEIKNRLIPLGGFASAIEKRADNPEKAREKAHIISQEVNKLEHLLRHITDFSKPIQLRFEECSINDLLAELIQRMQVGLAKGVTIKASLHPTPLQVRVDAERLEQVVVNLIRNAVEALESASSGTVTVCTRPQDESVEVLVMDDGPGIPEVVLENIFTPFFTTKKHGTGLGLAISRNIIIEHGGNLSCASNPNHGTTFTLTLPAV